MTYITYQGLWKDKGAAILYLGGGGIEPFDHDLMSYNLCLWKDKGGVILYLGEGVLNLLSMTSFMSYNQGLWRDKWAAILYRGGELFSQSCINTYSSIKL